MISQFQKCASSFGMELNRYIGVLIFFSAIFVKTDAVPDICDSVNNVETILEQTYYGWPFTFHFNILDEYVMYGVHYDLYDDTIDSSLRNIQFLVVEGDTSRTVYNSTENYDTESVDDEYSVLPLELFPNHFYTTPDVNESSATTYLLYAAFLESRACLSATYHINASTYSPRTCSQSVAQNMKVFREHSNGAEVFLSCTAPASQVPKIEVPATATYKWTRNCGELPESVRDQQNNNTLWFTAVTYDDPGIYDCEIEYNGVKIFVTHTGFCVNTFSEQTQPQIACERTALFQNYGDDVMLSCVGTVGVGTTDFLLFTASWSKFDSSNYDCGHSGDANETVNEDNARVSCRFYYDDLDVCYMDPPQIEPENIVRRLNYEMLISNTQEIDSGLYRFTLQSNLEGTYVANETIYLGLDPTRGQIKVATIVGSCIGSVVILVLLYAVLWWNMFQIRLLWKRKFSKPVEDTMANHAYLSYHVTTLMTSSDNDEIRRLRNITMDTLKELGYGKVLDHNRDVETGTNTAGQIRANIEHSHRLIILLTTPYTREHSHLAVLYEGLLELINIGKEIIFIAPVGVRKYIKSRARKSSDIDNSQFRTIHVALQEAHVVDWSSNSNFNEQLFKDKLEFFMPKLQQKKPGTAAPPSGTTNHQFLHESDLELQRV